MVVVAAVAAASIAVMAWIVRSKGGFKMGVAVWVRVRSRRLFDWWSCGGDLRTRDADLVCWGGLAWERVVRMVETARPRSQRSAALPCCPEPCKSGSRRWKACWRIGVSAFRRLSHSTAQPRTQPCHSTAQPRTQPCSLVSSASRTASSALNCRQLPAFHLPLAPPLPPHLRISSAPSPTPALPHTTPTSILQA